MDNCKHGRDARNPCKECDIEIEREEDAERARKLRVVAAALYVEFNGYELTFSVPAPGRHSDVISAMNSMGLGAHCHGREIQGFLLSDGTFARRSVALGVAKRANQIIRRCGGDERELFSENVW